MSSGTSSGSSSLRTTTQSSSRSSEDDMNLQAQMENRRKRRKESNRESARRSRLRKQQHLDDLNTQVNQLKEQNKHLGAAARVTNQNLVAVQAQNSVLHTQKMELETRLGSLTEMLLLYLNAATSTAGISSVDVVSSNTTTTTGIIMNTGCITTTTPTPGDVILGGAAGAWNQLPPVDHLYYRPCF